MALALCACVAPAWDPAALERRYPALAALDGPRLSDVTPYPWPRRGELVWFLCRWPDAALLRTSLPADATEREQELLRRALASWEAAGPGVRFVPTDDTARAEIAISVGRAAETRAASTAAECGVDEGPSGLRARLVHARITLRRTASDTLGRPVALREEEWLGAALHELGHALGFQGHARGGPGIMVREAEQVRRIGRAVLGGQPLRAPSVAALYRVPSGTVLARLPLAAGATRALDRLAELAVAEGYRGPLVRVGDTSARLAWWDPTGRSVGVRIPGIRETLRDPDRLTIVPDLLASSWLGPGAGH